MPGFTGKFYNTVDPKGRVIVPAPFRNIINTNYSNTLFVTNAAFDSCLLVYPLEEWQRLLEKVKALPQMKRSVRWFMRKVIASAHECGLDRQGRILVPASLRKDANINGEVAIVGQIDRFEIWNKEEWDRETDPSRIDRQELEEELASLGI